MTRELKYKPDHCAIAEQVLAGGESLAAVCCELDITRTTLYEWRDTYPEFRDAIERGLQRAQREWENIGQKGATGGYEKFGNAAWIFTMKNRFRADYQEQPESKPISDSLVEKILNKLAD
jgi:hypothetical protein